MYLILNNWRTYGLAMMIMELLTINEQQDDIQKFGRIYVIVQLWMKYKCSRRRIPYLNSVVVIPSNLRWEMTKQAVPMPRPKPQYPKNKINHIISKTCHFINIDRYCRQSAYLRASGTTFLFVLSYGGGTPSYALSLASAAAPRLVLWGIILKNKNKKHNFMQIS